MELRSLPDSLAKDDFEHNDTHGPDFPSLIVPSIPIELGRHVRRHWTGCIEGFNLSLDEEGSTEITQTGRIS